MPHSAPRSDCPLAKSLCVLGDRWSLLVIRDMLLEQKTTFNEFLESPERIPTNTLTNRLRKLEDAGLIRKSAYQEKPLRYRYELTAAGQALDPVLRSLHDWCCTHFATEFEPA